MIEWKKGNRKAVGDVLCDIKITATLSGGGYFLLEKMSTMYRTSLIIAMTKFIDKNAIITVSVVNMASPPFERILPTALLIDCPGEL